MERKLSSNKKKNSMITKLLLGLTVLFGTSNYLETNADENTVEQHFSSVTKTEPEQKSDFENVLNLDKLAMADTSDDFSLITRIMGGTTRALTYQGNAIIYSYPSTYYTGTSNSQTVYYIKKGNSLVFKVWGSITNTPSMGTINITRNELMAMSEANIDKVKPLADVSLSTTAFTKDDITITLSNIRDLESGYYRTKLPNGTYSTSTTIKYTISTNGTCTFLVYDNAGNVQTYNVVITNSDTTPPSATLTQTPTKWTNGNVMLNLTATDNTGGSGIDYVVLPNGTISKNTTISYEVTENGIYSFEVFDKVGNSVVKTITVSNIERILPFGTVSYSTIAHTKDDVVITITGGDNESGFSHIVLPNSTIATTSTVNYTVSRNGLYDFYVTDIAGNQLKLTAVVSNIDRGLPLLDFLTIFQSEDEVDVEIQYGD